VTVSGRTGALAGKVAIVTGSGRGLGRATARRLAADGAALVLADIDQTTVHDAADEIGRAGGAAQAVHADVADEGECQRVVCTALESFGGADILVNVANYPVPRRGPRRSALTTGISRLRPDRWRCSYWHGRSSRICGRPAAAG
jgi:NAD(P)-dependent dehydrogenase (short-subunit alcohol dehydrogenase family)